MKWLNSLITDAHQQISHILNLYFEHNVVMLKSKQVSNENDCAEKTLIEHISANVAVVVVSEFHISVDISSTFGSRRQSQPSPVGDY